MAVLLKPQLVANRLGVSLKTLYRMRVSGELPALNIRPSGTRPTWRYQLDVVEAFERGAPMPTKRRRRKAKQDDPNGFRAKYK